MHGGSKFGETVEEAGAGAADGIEVAYGADSFFADHTERAPAWLRGIMCRVCVRGIVTQTIQAEQDVRFVFQNPFRRNLVVVRHSPFR